MNTKKSTDRWIKITTPPEKDGMYIVAHPSGVGVGFWKKQSGKFLDEPNGFEIINVTHYQPMPDYPGDN